MLELHQTNLEYRRRFVRLTHSKRRKLFDQKNEEVGAAMPIHEDLPEYLDWRELGICNTTFGYDSSNVST